MDQEKMGKFIAKCRNEKELTQEELGSLFNISAQAVSKWEKGKSAPDISILPELCEVLDISLEEFFQMKKDKGLEDNSNNSDFRKSTEKVLVDGVQFYEKSVVRKYSKRIFCIIFCSIIFVMVLLLLYFLNNYNKIKIYSMYSENDNLLFNGKVIFNPNNKIVMINNIEYNDEFVGTVDEKQAKKLMISINTLNGTIIEYGDLKLDGDESLQSFNDLLDDIEIEYYEKNDDKSGIRVADLSDVYLVISFINKKGEIEKIEYKLSMKKEFENSNIFYK